MNMKTIQWKIVITDDNRILSMENAQGFSQNSMESNLTIVGLLENLKKKHLEKLDTLYQQTVKVKVKSDEDDIDDIGNDIENNDKNEDNEEDEEE